MNLQSCKASDSAVRPVWLMTGAGWSMVIRRTNPSHLIIRAVKSLGNCGPGVADVITSIGKLEPEASRSE